MGGCSQMLQPTITWPLYGLVMISLIIQNEFRMNPTLPWWARHILLPTRLYFVLYTAQQPSRELLFRVLPMAECCGDQQRCWMQPENVGSK
jgi:hypothetical protein